MSDDKIISAIDSMDTVQGSAEAAAELEREAEQTLEPNTYTHFFARPIEYNGLTIKDLTFDFGALSGDDFLIAENESRISGVTTVTPEFSGAFLWNLSVRACTLRGENGRRLIRGDFRKKMDVGDFFAIYKKARAFLLVSGS